MPDCDIYSEMRDSSYSRAIITRISIWQSRSRCGQRHQRTRADLIRLFASTVTFWSCFPSRKVASSRVLPDYLASRDGIVRRSIGCFRLGCLHVRLEEYSIWTGFAERSCHLPKLLISTTRGMKGNLLK